MNFTDTICALATAQGEGALAVIRLSGEQSFEITQRIFKSKKGNKILAKQKPYTIHFGDIFEDDTLIDEVLVSIFKAPHSYTGENSVEISCHGSLFIQNKIMQLLIQNGARTASPGEFTQRAFLNGKMDLSQAEAVADLISSQSKASHKVALQHMRGGFTHDLQNLRNQLLTFISLIELELDFSEEDVEFADRTQLSELILNIKSEIKPLINSFRFGNALKNGIPVAIIGEPNVGKSTLLNVLLNEDKAIVSDIAGTTRDAIEDTVSISGFLFRFIDTAGIRQTDDTVENLGIDRTKKVMSKAEIIILMLDAEKGNFLEKISELESIEPNKIIIPIINKSDLTGRVNPVRTTKNGTQISYISAKYRQNINELKERLVKSVQYDIESNSDTIITNSRHYELLTKSTESIERVISGLEQNISGDFLAQDIREILNYIGEITGEYTTDEVLGNIFANFCIGK